MELQRFKYTCGTMDLKIPYYNVQDFNLVGYFDSHWARSCDDKKSTGGFVLNLGSSIVASTS